MGGAHIIPVALMTRLGFQYLLYKINMFYKIGMFSIFLMDNNCKEAILKTVTMRVRTAHHNLVTQSVKNLTNIGWFYSTREHEYCDGHQMHLSCL